MVPAFFSVITCINGKFFLFSFFFFFGVHLTTSFIFTKKSCEIYLSIHLCGFVSLRPDPGGIKLYYHMRYSEKGSGVKLWPILCLLKEKKKLSTYEYLLLFLIAKDPFYLHGMS